MDLDSQRFDVVGTIRSTGKVAQVELNLIPTVVQSHGHGADEGLDARRRLVVRGPEAASDIFII